MDPVRNPYVPGAGRRPAALVGRDSVLERWQVALQRAERGLPDPPFILYGLRGVGKTVLLSQMRRDAEAREWIALQIEAGTGLSLRQMVGEGLYAPLADITRPSAGRRLLRALKTALSFKASYDSSGTWSFGVDLSDVAGGGADSGVLEADLHKLVKDVSQAAAEDGVGLALLVDEAQDLAPEELATLSSLGQATAQDGWPFLIVLAGLPSLPQRLAEAKSYAERFTYIEVESLDEADARAALTRPAEDEDVRWEADALSHVVEEAGRYPYFLQQFGQAAWNAADASPIDLSAARAGVTDGRSQLDTGFFRARWERATATERAYLRAMAPEGDDRIAVSVVAKRLGKTVAAVSTTRTRLIAKTLIYVPEYGKVAFTVPGMSSFIMRQHDTE